MIIPEQFHFLRPLWLFAFIPLVFLVWSMLGKKMRSRSWESICDSELLPYILISTTSSNKRFPAFLIALCGGLAILSLAGPVWEKLPEPVFGTQSALVIALDLSGSMDATDISPSRLARARFKVADILSRRIEGQTALLVYAGDVFVVTPLTDDVATIQLQLNALTTDIIPVQGNRTDLALSNSVELLKQAGAGKGDILLITDEIEVERNASIVNTLKSEGYRLSVIGVGTLEGGPVIQADGGFMKDSSGDIIIPKLVEEPMRQLATLGGGQYQKMTLNEEDIKNLEKLFDSGVDDSDITETGLETDVWYERGPWLLLLIIPFAAIVFRRGYLVLLATLVLPYSQPAQAFEWDSLWLRPDQRAQEAFKEQQHETASMLFQDPAWKGVANYRNGDFDAAINFLDGLEDVESHYNLGNALARKGMYEQAIAAYDRVLEQRPEHEDARFNKELLEKELEEQQEQEQQAQSQQSEQGESEEQEPGQGESQEQDQQDDGQEQNEEQGEQENEQQQQETNSDQQEPGEMDPGDMQSGIESLESRANEEQQATEQWLRRIPDDPGGLLRRKFLYQYQHRQHSRVPGEKTW